MTSVAILSFSHINGDARVLRQIQYLAPVYAVTIVGYGLEDGLTETVQVANMVQTVAIHNPSSRERRLRKALYLPFGRFVSKKFYEWWYWREEEFQQAYEILVEQKPDIIHANDWESLPVAARAAAETGTKIVLDLHEYAPAMWGQLALLAAFLQAID